MTETNTVAPLRRTNLEAWMEKNDLNKSDLAGRLGVGRAYVSLIFRPDRFFGERAARSMELKLNMPTGYLDSDLSKPMPTENWSSPDDLSPDSYALVPRVYLQIKDGAVVSVEAPLPPLAFSQTWLRGCNITAKENLRLVSVRGDSMEPYLRNKDEVLIDTGSQEVDDSSIYAIAYGPEIKVKMLGLRFDGGLFIRSTNPKYPDEVLSASDAEHIQRLGRVVWRAG